MSHKSVKTFSTLLCIVVGLHAATLAACSANAPSSRLKVTSYDGDTDKTMVRFFENVPYNSTVVINSKGGKEADAISVGEIVVKKSITIEVDRFCASSCAQYIFIASKTRKVRSNAVVSFHVNSFGARKIGLTKSSAADVDAERARKLYSSVGIDPEFMTYSTRSVGPFCTKDDGSGRQKYAAWLPSYTQLNKWKITVEGRWFISRADAMNAIRSIYRPGTAITYGDENESPYSSGIAKCVY